jgi:hypothetical protein
MSYPRSGILVTSFQNNPLLRPKLHNAGEGGVPEFVFTCLLSGRKVRALERKRRGRRRRREITPLRVATTSCLHTHKGSAGIPLGPIHFACASL